MTADRPRRPAFLSPNAVDSHAANPDLGERAKAAHRSAWSLIEGAQNNAGNGVLERLQALGDEDGMSLLAELWSHSSADSLPGALWRLYVVRAWVHRCPEQASEQFVAGRSRAQVHEVVAGVAEPPDPSAVVEMVDATLGGLASNDLGSTFERAAAFLRVVAVGRAALSVKVSEGIEHPQPPPNDEIGLVTSAGRLLGTAEELESAARRWRAGTMAS